MTITREQVERATDAAYDCNAQGVNAALGAEWYKDPRIPSDVLAGWRETGYTSLYRALTRWRDELVAAETPRKVARWDARVGVYALTPPHAHDSDIDGLGVQRSATRGEAIAWGYTIEGGPEPIDDTDPERLRERREALGWNQTWAAEDINRLHGFTEDPWGWRCVASCEEGSASAIDRARYAAALSAAEAERPAKPDPLAYADSPAWDDWPMPKPVPALEMVDVPQPVVKRMGDHTAAWERGESEVSIATKMAAGPDRVMGYPLALLRAMLAAIDAQQGGAS